MKTVLFDIYPSSGHIHPTLKMASILASEGSRIIYALPHEQQSLVGKYGFKTCLYIPWLDLKKNTFQKNCNPEIEIDELADMKSRLDKMKPNLIILDEQNAPKAILYKILNYPVALTQVMPDQVREKQIPPFTSYCLPTSSRISGFYVGMLWRKKMASVLLRRYYNKIKTRKNDAYSPIDAITKKHGILLNQAVDFYTSFNPIIKEVPRFIISPKAFDFPQPETDKVYRIGPLVNINREKKIELPRYSVLMRRISQIENNEERKVIYVSMGTVSNYDIKRCTKFLKRIVEVVRLNPQHLFVLSSGKFFDVSCLLLLPDNLMVFETVPQVDLLQKCDIMITHGGMNSITECVFTETPMLVYPLSRKWDQPGNSARVVYHNIGLRGRIERDSAKTISKKITKLVKEYTFYKENIVKMKELFEMHNNSTQIVDIISQIIEKNER